MSNIKELFAKNLKRLRETAGLTQAELGQELGQSASYVNQLESGKKGFTADSLEKYSEILKAPPSEFLTEKSIDILTGIRTFFMSLDILMVKLKESRSEILKNKSKFSDEEYLEQLEASDELVGRIGLLRASIEDHFKFFLGVETSIFTRKKPRLKNYSLMFNLFREKNYDISTDENGQEVWSLKPDAVDNLLRVQSEEDLIKQGDEAALKLKINEEIQGLSQERLQDVLRTVEIMKNLDADGAAEESV